MKILAKIIKYSYNNGIYNLNDAIKKGLVNMENTLKVGIEGRKDIVVSKDVSAKSAASGEMDVFGTPFVIALMEQAADQSVRPYLGAGLATVGTAVNISHTAATPMGMAAYAVSNLIEIDNRRLVFNVAVFDEAGKVAEGTHERFIIDKEKFMAKTQKRGSK